jgi:rhodanese-related sulfurtransferase
MPRGDRAPVSGLGLKAAFGMMLVFSASCAASRRVVASLTANCREVGVGVAHEILRDNPGVLLLDVRDKDDYAARLPHLPRAREIPLPDLPRRYRELGAWKRQPVLIFSRDGSDAASACEFLARQGFPYVSHVAGGVEAWIRGGYARAAQSGRLESDVP